MSKIPPARTPADRARVHIKALVDEMKRQAETTPPPAQMFLSGMLSGLVASVEILDGGSAEKSMELMVQRLSAAIGEAYLAGKLPPQPPDAEGELALCWHRRESLLAILTRAQRGRTLTQTEADTLRQHVETEMREADTARAVAAGNLRHVRTLVPELEQAQAAIARVRALLPDNPADDLRAPSIVPGGLRAVLDDAMKAASAPVTTGVTEGVRDALNSVFRTMVHDSRDWALNHREAWLYAILVGWSCEQEHSHDDDCMGDDPLTEAARKHRWDADTVARVREYRTAIAAFGIDGAGLPVNRAETPLIVRTTPEER